MQDRMQAQAQAQAQAQGQGHRCASDPPWTPPSFNQTITELMVNSTFNVPDYAISGNTLVFSLAIK